MSHIDYKAVTAASRRFKSALTRAKNRKDHAKIIEVCDQALAEFDRVGYPDCWHLWQVAREDARYALAREGC